FQDYLFIKDELDTLHKEHKVDRLVHGNANGPDKLSGRWAEENDIDVNIFNANWTYFGNGAGHIRNEEMAKFVAQYHPKHRYAIIFWDGKSPGTKGMINLVKRYKINHKIIRIDYDGYVDNVIERTKF